MAASFPSLTGSERYAILSLQPEPTRTAEDCDRLADAAVATGKLQESLQHVQAALARGSVDGRESDRQHRRVELLLQLGRASEAVSAAEQWAAGIARPPTELARMAEVLASHAQPQSADQLFGKAVEGSGQESDARYALFCRWAAARQGVARCEKLLAAAALKPSGSRERHQCVDLLRHELATAAQADTAAQLAAQTADAELAAELVFRQAELTANVPQAAELLWKLHESGRLDNARLTWACQTWNFAGQPARVIQACEAALRAGRRLASGTAAELALAYGAAHREPDAKRAGSRDAESASAAASGEASARQPGSGGFF